MYVASGMSTFHLNGFFVVWARCTYASYFSTLHHLKKPLFSLSFFISPSLPFSVSLSLSLLSLFPSLSFSLSLFRSPSKSLSLSLSLSWNQICNAVKVKTTNWFFNSSTANKTNKWVRTLRYGTSQRRSKSSFPKEFFFQGLSPQSFTDYNTQHRYWGGLKNAKSLTHVIIPFSL